MNLSQATHGFWDGKDPVAVLKRVSSTKVSCNLCPLIPFNPFWLNVLPSQCQPQPADTNSQDNSSLSCADFSTSYFCCVKICDAPTYAFDCGKKPYLKGISPRQFNPYSSQLRGLPKMGLPPVTIHFQMGFSTINQLFLGCSPGSAPCQKPGRNAATRCAPSNPRARPIG